MPRVVKNRRSCQSAAVTRADDLVLQRPGDLARTTRRYRLAGSPSTALARLAESAGIAVVTPDQAKQRRSSKPFVVIADDSFVVYQPWKSLLTTPEGAVVEDVQVGPALVGRVLSTGEGCVVEVQARAFAPTPRQRLRIGAMLGGSALLLLAMLVAAGPNPILLAIVGAIAMGTGVGVLAYRRGDRRQDIRDLHAIVERAFGPLELPLGDAGPHRGNRGTREP